MIKQTEEGGVKEGEMAGNSVRIESALSTNVKKVTKEKELEWDIKSNYP